MKQETWLGSGGREIILEMVLGTVEKGPELAVGVGVGVRGEEGT